MPPKMLSVETLDHDLTAMVEGSLKGPEAATVRAMVRSDEGTLGPLGKMLVVYRVLLTRRRMTAADMAASLWKELANLNKGQPLGMREDTFVIRLKRWFQPSQAPYVTLTEAQAQDLGEAAAGVAERLLEQEGVQVRRLLRQPWRSGLKLAGELTAADPTASPTRHIDPTFLLIRPLLAVEHEQVVNMLHAGYLSANQPNPAPLCVVGEPYSGKKGVLAKLVRRHIEGPGHLPILALSCASMTIAEVGERISAFLNDIGSDRRELLPITLEDELRLTRKYASNVPAVYVLADLEVLPPRGESVADNLIAQASAVTELIQILLRSNPRTRVVVSCSDPSITFGTDLDLIAPTARFPQMEWGGTDGGELSFTLIRLSPPRVEALLRELDLKVEAKTTAQILPYRNDVIDGAALHLCAALLRQHGANGELEKGIVVVTDMLEVARECRRRLEPKRVVVVFWGALPRLHRILCVVIAAAIDGIRESSLNWVLDRLEGEVKSRQEDRDTALENLHRAFGSVLRHEGSNPAWKLDGLPGELIDEPIYEFDRSTRVALLKVIEDPDWSKIAGNKTAGDDWDFGLVREVHRLIAVRAREQAHNRRLNVPGIYGGKLEDLLRDVQAVLSFAASADPRNTYSYRRDQGNRQSDRERCSATLNPLTAERNIMEGCGDAREVLRFAYLQLWREDIDRAYRLTAEHAADELRLHVLIAIAAFAGRSFLSTRPFGSNPTDLAILQSGIDAFRRPVFPGDKSVFSDDELLELLASLAMAGYQTGAFGVAQIAAEHAEKLSPSRPDALVLKVKIQRAKIDADILSGKLDLPHIEGVLRVLIEQNSGEEPQNLQACTKLQLRLGEVCHLQGNIEPSLKAFEEAVQLEARALAEESYHAGRSLVSGHGARRYLRAALHQAATEAVKTNNNDWKMAEEFITRAKDLQTISLRRLSRHAADRTGILLDDARISYTEGLLLWKRTAEKGRNVMGLYQKSRAALQAARAIVIKPGLPIAIRLELNGLTARLGVQLTDILESERPELLELSRFSALRLQKMADGSGLKIYMAYARLLTFQIQIATNGARSYRDEALVTGLREAKNICVSYGLGLYLPEIEECLALTSI